MTQDREPSTPVPIPPLLRERDQERPLWKRVLLLSAAVLCFIGGIAGWLVPVVTGIPFYLLGLIFLGMASKRSRDWINRLEARLSPRARIKLRHGLEKIPSERFHHTIHAIPPEVEAAYGVARDKPAKDPPGAVAKHDDAASR